MEAIQNTENSKIHVAIWVLTLINTEIIKWGLKPALVHDYPDLNGLVHCGGLPDEDVWLLENATNIRSRLFNKYSNAINVHLNSYLNLFGLMEDDNRSSFEEATDIFFAFIVNEGMEPVDDLDIDIDIFVFSLLQLIYWLCEMVIVGKLNIESAQDLDYCFNAVFEGHWDGYINHENHGYSMLAKIMEKTVAFYYELMTVLHQ